MCTTSVRSTVEFVATGNNARQRSAPHQLSTRPPNCSLPPPRLHVERSGRRLACRRAPLGEAVPVGAATADGNDGDGPVRLLVLHTDGIPTPVAALPAEVDVSSPTLIDELVWRCVDSGQLLRRVDVVIGGVARTDQTLGNDVVTFLLDLNARCAMPPARRAVPIPTSRRRSDRAPPTTVTNTTVTHDVRPNVLPHLSNRDGQHQPLVAPPPAHRPHHHRRPHRAGLLVKRAPIHPPSSRPPRTPVRRATPLNGRSRPTKPVLAVACADWASGTRPERRSRSSCVADDAADADQRFRRAEQANQACDRPPPAQPVRRAGADLALVDVIAHRSVGRLRHLRRWPVIDSYCWRCRSAW